MGVFDFLKKKGDSAIAPPAAPAGVSPISKHDEKLSSPVAPPTTLPPAPKPPSAAPSAPSMPSLPPLSPPKGPEPLRAAQKLPPLPTLPSAPKTPSAPPVSAPKAPEMPKPITPPSAPSPMQTMHPASRVSIPQPVPPMSGKPSNLSNTHVPEPEKPVISAPTIPKPPASPAPTSAKTGQVPVAQLRQVIEELRNIPLDLPAEKERKPTPKPEEKAKPAEKPKAAPAGPKHAFVPVEHFDECIRAIRSMHTGVHAVQAGNERAGAFEAQEKEAADSLASACDSIQSTLLAVDERLFQVN